MNKDSHALLFATLLVISSVACIVFLPRTANAQGDEIVLEGTDFSSTTTIQSPQNLSAVDISRIVIEYGDFALTRDVNSPNGMPSPSISRIVIEYADAAIQVDVQPPQDRRNPDVSRIAVEYADYAKIVDTSAYYSGPQPMGKNDTTRPDIGILIRTPEGDVPEYQEVTISVNITDVDGGVKNSTLQYSLDNGAGWTIVPMTLNLSAYSNSLSVSYYGTIPGQSNGTWVYFRVIAYDYAWNTATRDGESPYGPYQVVPEYSPITVILFLAISSLSALVLEKKRCNQKP